MRRIAAIALVVLAAAAVLVTTGADSGDDGHVRIDAIFDNVAFLTEGQDVRVAGANAGKVESLSITKDKKARVEMSVDKRLAPFRADADCVIEPQSLLGDRFVNCTPGTPAAAELPDGPDGAPTVGLAHTHAPVDLDLVLSSFKLPVRQRAAILISGLGTGLAARGDDLNEAILRANPALAATRRTLAIVDGDRARLQGLITSSDTILAALSGRREGVARFVRDSSRLLAASAGRQSQLAEAVRGLPPLLAQAQPALAEVSRLAQAGKPSIEALGRAAPDVNTLLAQLDATAPRIRPTVEALGSTARSTTKAIPAIAPQIKRLRGFAAQAPAAGAELAPLLVSLRDRGGIEGLQSFPYFGASATARFDKTSHMLPAYALVGPCALQARTPLAGCDAHFASSAKAAAKPTAQPAARPKTQQPITGKQNSALLDYFLGR